MKFDWEEFLELARFLLPSPQLGKKPSQAIESKLRSSISRAYYAAYNIADDYARQRLAYSRPATGADHKALTDHYEYLWETTKNELFDNIASELKSMRAKRKQADYQAGQKIVYDDADYCIESAEAVIKDINSLNVS
jgi:uncharacterized protein (UPF0332 family)